MTKEQVRDALVLVAEECEAAFGANGELQAIARAYRRAAALVEDIEVRRGPGRPPGSGLRAVDAPRRVVRRGVRRLA